MEQSHSGLDERVLVDQSVLPATGSAASHVVVGQRLGHLVSTQSAIKPMWQRLLPIPVGGKASRDFPTAFACPLRIFDTPFRSVIQLGKEVSLSLFGKRYSKLRPLRYLGN